MRIDLNQFPLSACDLTELLVIKFIHQADAKNPPRTFRAMAENHGHTDEDSEDKDNV